MVGSAATVDRPRVRIAVGLVLLLCTLAFAYAPVLDAGFLTYDDNKYVTDNPVIQAGLTRQGVAWAFTAIHDANWIPLVWISLMVDHELYGLAPAGYHATNLLFHGLSTLLLFAALFRLTGAPWRSGFVAGLFALHPLHVQSVAWIAERKDVLSGFFWMATLLAYTFHVARPSAARYAAMVLAFALGLLCKATLVTLPFVLLLLDFWPADRMTGGPRRVARLVAEKVPLLVLSALASAMTLEAQGQGGAIRMVHLDLPGRVANALLSYAVYLRKTVWPSDLSFFYPHAQPDLASFGVWAAGAGLAAATIGVGLWALRRPAGRPVAVGWLWYLGTLVPMIGLVQVGGQAMADRYMYLPLVGLGLAVAFAWPRVDGAGATPGRVVAGVAMVAVLGACALVTRVEAARWQDSESLYRRAVDLDVDNYNAHYELARYLNSTGRHAEAETHAREAVRLVPIWADAYLNLGAALIGQQRHTEAVDAIRRALARDPDSVEARLLMVTALIEGEQLEEARVELRRLVQRVPGHLGARLSLGSIEEQLGHREAALVQYDLVWRSAPGSSEAGTAAARLAWVVDRWPDAPESWLGKARAAARALAAVQPESFDALAQRLAERPATTAADAEKP